MTQNKKLWGILIVFILLPIILLLFGKCIVSDKYFFWGYSCSANYIYLINILVILGTILVFFFNHKNNKYKLLWYLISALIFLVSIAHLFIYNSLSHFGF